MNYQTSKKIAAVFLASAVLFTGYSAYAYVASSTNYRIQSDSLNVGGVRQTSSNYISEDTIGEIATGLSASDLYRLKAGYQQMQEIYIAITAASDVVMSPAIPGISGGIGNGQTSWTVTTDDPAGYSLSIKASSSPALVFGSYSFADYVPGGDPAPDFDWSVGASASEFGFTPEGSHINVKFKDDGVDTCNTGSTDTADACWYYLSTSSENIAGSSSGNHPSGTLTTVKFRAESGASHVQQEGTYTATSSVTAIAL